MKNIEGFRIYYIDDAGMAHIAQVREQWEVNFFRDRFEIVEVENES
jgi:hypothetical protein